MIEHIDALQGLQGTSTEKIGELLKRLRSDSRASFGLGLAERLPGGYGDAVRWIVNDLPDCEPDEIDAALSQVADVVLSLRSDSRQLVEGA